MLFILLHTPTFGEAPFCQLENLQSKTWKYLVAAAVSRRMDDMG
jgi:hypothetical protein